MTISGSGYDLTDYANAFHQVFKKDKKYDIFNFKNRVLNLIGAVEGAQGTNTEFMRVTSLMGGCSMGSLPYANPTTLIRPRVTPKKQYATAILDREAMAESMKDEGSFVNTVLRAKFDIKKGVENMSSLNLYKSNIDNEVVLGIITGTPTGSDPYVCTLDDGAAGDPHMSNFHIGMIVTVEDGNTDLFEVTAIDRDAFTVTLDRLTGSQVPADNDEIMFQGADGNGFDGLVGATAASGTYLNVTIGEGWKAYRKDLNGSALQPKDIWEALLDIENQCGEIPNVIACGLTQYKKIAEYLENKGVNNDNKDVMGHGALALDGPEGKIPVIWDKHIENDRLYLLNTNRMQFRKRPMSGLVEASGSVLISDHANGNDRYLIIYACYGNFFIEPTFQGLIFDAQTT